MSIKISALRARANALEAQLKLLRAELDQQIYAEMGEDIRNQCPDGEDHKWRAIEWTHEIQAPKVRALGVVRQSNAYTTYRRGGKWVCHCGAEMTIR